MSADSSLTHLNAQGQAHMVDIRAKPSSARRAIASGLIHMQATTLTLIQKGEHRKGDVLAVARIAAIMAAKRSADLIPLCHTLALTHVSAEFSFLDTALRLTVTADTIGQTGVEMEALTAVSVGLLTIYDMCKAIDRAMTLDEIALLEKSGGRSGHWQRTASAEKKH